MEGLTFPIIKDGVLLLLAVYGAALSTFNWLQASRKDKRTVKMNLSTVMPAVSGRLGACFWRVQATNVGHRPLTIGTLALELPSGERLYNVDHRSGFIEPDTPLPAGLTDGQSAHLYVSYADVGAALLQAGRTHKIKLRPVSEDTAGNVYRGKAFEVDPHELTRM